MRAPKSERKASALSLPLFADGVHLDTPELLACQELARALPDVRSQASASMAGHRARDRKSVV